MERQLIARVVTKENKAPITPAPESPIMQQVQAQKRRYKARCCEKYKKGKQCKRCPKIPACHLPKAFQDSPFKL